MNEVVLYIKKEIKTLNTCKNVCLTNPLQSINGNIRYSFSFRLKVYLIFYQADFYYYELKVVGQRLLPSLLFMNAIPVFLILLSWSYLYSNTAVKNLYENHYNSLLQWQIGYTRTFVTPVPMPKSKLKQFQFWNNHSLVIHVENFIILMDCAISVSFVNINNIISYMIIYDLKQ